MKCSRSCAPRAGRISSMRRSNEARLISRNGVIALCTATLLAAVPEHVAGAQGKVKTAKPAKTDTSLAARMRRDSLEAKKLAKLPHDSSQIAPFYAESAPIAMT